MSHILKERIPAADVQEPKKWNLPYWTEPDHLVAQEVAEEDASEEDIEIEPLTAEQLEQIRQEAYNEGLEQGLVEGRQKGEKLGFESGHKEGFSAGEEEGKKVGFDSGYKEGEQTATQEGTARTDQKVEELTTLMKNLLLPIEDQRQQLESVISMLVTNIAEAVITESLSQGSEHIVHLTKLALDALPAGSKNLTLYVHSSDLPYLEAAIEQYNLNWDPIEDDQLTPGGCKIETEHSLIDFTLESRWQLVLEQFKEQLLVSELQDFELDEEQTSEKLTENASKEIIDDAAVPDTHHNQQHEDSTQASNIDTAADEQNESEDLTSNALKTDIPDRTENSDAQDDISDDQSIQQGAPDHHEAALDNEPDAGDQAIENHSEHKDERDSE